SSPKKSFSFRALQRSCPARFICEPASTSSPAFAGRETAGMPWRGLFELSQFLLPLPCHTLGMSVQRLLPIRGKARMRPPPEVSGRVVDPRVLGRGADIARPVQRAEERDRPVG